jgi:hypothetical protein
MVRQRIVTERMDTLRTVVQSTISMAQSLETRMATLQFTHEDAWSRLPVDIQGIRFDARFIR